MHASLKRFHFLTTAVITVLSTATLSAATAAPGYVDLGHSPPPAGGGTFVEVNIPRNLIAFAARLTSEDEPEIGRLLEGLESVRVNVVEIDDGNRDELQQRIAHVREQVARNDWHQIVSLRDGDEQIDVFVKIRDDEVIEGLAVVVLEGDDEAVFVNIVGDIQPEQIAVVGARFGIDPLKQVGASLDDL